MFPVRPRGQPAEAEFGLSGDQPYSSAIPTPKDPCYKVDPEPPPGAGGQKIGSAWSNDGCANILNSDRYREQSRASALSDYAGAASGYSGKLQAYAHLVAANSLHSPPHPQRARDAILMISAFSPPMRLHPQLTFSTRGHQQDALLGFLDGASLCKKRGACDDWGQNEQRCRALIPFRNFSFFLASLAVLTPYLRSPPSS